MIIVNTTFVVNDELRSDILAWLSEAYGASAAKMGAQTMVARVMGHDGEDTATYAMHAAFPTLAEAERWDNGVAAKLRQRLAERWGEKALPFVTYLETV